MHKNKTKTKPRRDWPLPSLETLSGFTPWVPEVKGHARQLWKPRWKGMAGKVPGILFTGL